MAMLVYQRVAVGFNFHKLSPLLVEMMQFDEYVSNGLKPPTTWSPNDLYF